ncbi:DUF6644 family protein [Cupriavidus sp. 8B]
MMSLVQWIHATGFATVVRESSWVYPILQVIHVFGMCILAGSVSMFDLRLLGLGRNLSLTQCEKHFLPWAWSGFALMVLTGPTMAIGFIDVFSHNPVMGLKLTLILIAGLNAAFFHARIAPRKAKWDTSVDTPRSAKIAAIVSLTLWISIITMGKLLGYIGGKD